MSEMKKQALLCWLQKVLHQQNIKSLQRLRSGQLLAQLCSKIQGINIRIQQHHQSWQDSYFLLKKISEDLNLYMANDIKYKFPNLNQTMNLVEMAKGQDDEGLLNLLTLIFLVCFSLEPQRSEIFVEKAILLPQNYQQELMDIVKNNPVPKIDDSSLNQQERRYSRQRQTITQLLNAVQNLTLQNDSLRDVLIIKDEQYKKISDLLKKNEIQKQKIKKQLLQFYRQRQQNQPANNIMSEHHQQMIQLLKSNLMDQQKGYSRQIFQLTQKLQSTQQQLQNYRGRVLTLQQSSLTSITDHTNCISRQLYKKQVSQLNQKITQISSKQWKSKLQTIQITNQLEQIKEKHRKLLQDKKDKQNNQQVLIGAQDANNLKKQFYTRLRDSLKKNLISNNHSNQNNTNNTNNNHNNTNNTNNNHSNNSQNKNDIQNKNNIKNNNLKSNKNQLDSQKNFRKMVLDEQSDNNKQ